jgi:hypothetical protein
MREIVPAALACGLLASPAFAASAKIETAVKTFEQVGADAAKLKTYCAMSKVMSSGEESEDESKSEALDKEMQGYMKELGPEFESAFEAGADLDPDSEDGKAYDAALEALDGKCGQ